MAKMIPSVPTEGTPPSEQHLFRLFEEQLDDAWTVLHSVPFTERERDRASDGEIDFVLLHPQRGVIVVEVKGGKIDVRDGRWTSTDRYGETHHLPRTPFEQCRVGKYALRNIVEEHLPRRHQRFVIGHVVVVPSARLTGDLGADGKRETIWDVGDLHDIEKAIDGTLGYLGPLSSLTKDEFAVVVGALRPTATIGSLLHAIAQESSERQHELTDEQLRTMGGLRDNKRAVIVGGAGTGKTVLAVEHAKWLVEGGKSVGIFCFNEALGKKLTETFAAEDRVEGQVVAAGYIHGYMEETVRAAGLELPSSETVDGAPDTEYYKSILPELFVDAALELNLCFDALVVDEGQDFDADWLTRLELLLESEDGQLFVFADDRQNLYDKDWKPPFDGANFTLSINCRNTEPIAALASKTIRRNEPALRIASGQPPQNMPSTTDDATVDKVRELVDRLVTKENFHPSQLAVLTQRSRHRDVLGGTHVAGTQFVTFACGQEQGVLVETIYKFKGLEADVAIVLLDDLSTERNRALAYVGMSRAKTLLFTISPPEVVRELNALSTN